MLCQEHADNSCWVMATDVNKHAAGVGASSVEVYGFVGWITSAVGYVIFIVWAYLPEQVLLSFGVTYYPDKHWALTLPVWAMMLVFFVYWVYESLNMTTVHNFASLYTLHDEKSKWAEQLGMSSVVRNTAESIPPLVHIPAPVVSRVLYGGQSVQEAETEERMFLQPKIEPG